MRRYYIVSYLNPSHYTRMNLVQLNNSSNIMRFINELFSGISSPWIATILMASSNNWQHIHVQHGIASTRLGENFACAICPTNIIDWTSKMKHSLANTPFYIHNTLRYTSQVIERWSRNALRESIWNIGSTSSFTISAHSSPLYKFTLQLSTTGETV